MVQITSAARRLLESVLRGDIEQRKGASIRLVDRASGASRNCVNRNRCGKPIRPYGHFYGQICAPSEPRRRQAPGAILKRLASMRANVKRYILSPRRPKRSYPRAVKIEMSSYDRKRPPIESTSQATADGQPPGSAGTAGTRSRLTERHRA